MNHLSKENEKLKFWNERADLGFQAGTNDTVLKILEMTNISKYVRDGMKVLDLGCGNGWSAFELMEKFDIEIFGIDFSERMIESARDKLKESKFIGRANFKVGDIRDLQVSEKFDLIYTERALINLDAWTEQKKAIIDICGLLKKEGTYIMCENSVEGLESINDLRMLVDLPRIDAPWHNTYFLDKDVTTLSVPDCYLEKIEYISSTYYFLSRVINAVLAKQKGIEPSYDSPVNLIAKDLPSLGNLGQTRLWIWKKQ